MKSPKNLALAFLSNAAEVDANNKITNWEELNNKASQEIDKLRNILVTS